MFIESLDDISEKDSVGLPNKSHHTINEESKSKDLSENSFTETKEKKRKPNLHIFTHSPHNNNALFFDTHFTRKEKRFFKL